MLVRVEPVGAASYLVEVSDCGRPAFRRIGALCVQPLLEVDDFSAIPEPQRAAFAQLEGWLKRTPDAVVLPSPLPPALGAIRALDPPFGRAPVALLFALFGAAAASLTAARWKRIRPPSDAWPAWEAPRTAGSRLLRAAGGVALAWTPPRWRGPMAAAAGLAALAGVLRGCFGAFDLHHYRLGVLWVAAVAVDPSEVAHYGPGYVEVLAPVVRAVVRLSGAAADQALFGVSAGLGVLLPVLTFVLARNVGLRGRPAIAAALVAAVDPVAVRFAASEAYHNLVLALSLGAATAVTAGVRLAANPPLPGWDGAVRGSDGVVRGWPEGGGFGLRGVAAKAWRRAPVAGCVLAAAGLVTQGVRVHPSGWLPLGLALLVGLASPAPAGLRWRVVTLAVAVTGSAVLAVDGAVIHRVLDGLAAGDLFRGGTNASDAAPPALLAASAAVLAGVISRQRALGIVAALHLVAWLATRGGFGQSASWQASYDWLYLPVLLTFGAALASRWVRPFRGAGLFFTAGLAFWATTRAPVAVVADDTPRLERRALAGWLRGLPADCRTVHVGFVSGDDLLLPTYAAPAPEPRRFVRLDARAALDAPTALGAVGCTFYVRTSLCATAAGGAACAEAERQLRLDPEPVFARAVPALPAERYPGAERSGGVMSVSIEVYRVRGTVGH